MFLCEALRHERVRHGCFIEDSRVWSLLCPSLTVSVRVCARDIRTWRKLWLKLILGQVLYGLPTGMQTEEAKPTVGSALSEATLILNHTELLEFCTNALGQTVAHAPDIPVGS